MRALCRNFVCEMLGPAKMARVSIHPEAKRVRPRSPKHWNAPGGRTCGRVGAPDRSERGSRLPSWVRELHCQVCRRPTRRHNGDHEPQFGRVWLDEMIRTLPEGYREAVHMGEIDERSQQYVVNQFGLSLSGAKSRIQRGRAMLEDVLQQCCSFELDSRGRVMGCEPMPNQNVVEIARPDRIP